MHLRAVLLDMDGTVFDSHLDWLELRRSMGLRPDGRPILAQLEEASAADRSRCLAILHAAEREGAERGELIPGARALVDALRGHGVACVLVTNNSRESTDTVLARHPLPFDLVMTRDDGAMKPDPEAFLLPLARLGLRPDEAAAVGDTHLDAVAAYGAGLAEILLVGLPEWMRSHIPTDVTYREVADLMQARTILESWIASDALPDG
ncbi:MAG: HAD family hydrolase [Candidatus Bipolaricaulia bacterium]